MAALNYAARGWKIFPVHNPVLSASRPASCSCGKENCNSIGKHPRTKNGFQDATTDAEIIREWWERWPGANVAIPTGKVNGIIVLDEDLKHGGDQSLQEQIEKHGDLPFTIRAITGGGGSHTFFKHPGEAVPNSVGEDGWLKLAGLDIRGDGGYVCASPSQHASGRRYAWDDGQAPDEVELAPLPAWIMNRLRARLAPKPALTDQSPDQKGRYWLGQALAKAAPGSRNNVCLWMACQLRDNGVREDDAERIAREYAARVPQGSAPFTDHEAVSTVQSAYKTRARGPASRPPHGIRAHHTPLQPDQAEDQAYIIEDPAPLRLAEHYIDATARTNTGEITLRRYRQSFWRFSAGAYRQVSDETEDAGIYQHLDKLSTPKRNKEGSPTGDTVPLTVKAAVVREVRLALPSSGLLVDSSMPMPHWLDGRKSPNAADIVAFRNGLLDTSDYTQTGKTSLMPATPAWFKLRALSIRFRPSRRVSIVVGDG